MKKILITGATGNIGAEVIRFLFQQNTMHHVIAGVREINSAQQTLNTYPSLHYRLFDFAQPETFDAALTGIDSIFLLRPPQLADVQKYFAPLIETAVKQGITDITFLSVQGVERSSVIPHHKIERLIRQSGLRYCFLRPSYFMQNLTTTLLYDIKSKQKIILPAGRAKFNWVDTANIGEVAASILNNFERFENQAFDITGYKNKNFYEVANILTDVLGRPITFESPDPLSYYLLKRREGMETTKILVMIMLHFLPRFQKEPVITRFYEQVTGKQPRSLQEFLEQSRSLLL
ncbi:MAG: NmrA family NAD(P)-binding protein [Saprospiraceae bacterium]